MSDRVMIVDGYNVIRSSARYLGLSRRDLDAARARLVSDVSAISGTAHAVVVFDGASNPESDGQPQEIAGVEVVFSAYGKDADSVIEAMAGSYREKGSEVDVVTSDAQTQWVVLGQGAHRISSAQFSEMVDTDEEDRLDRNPAGGMRSTLEDRVPASVRQALSRMAKGDSRGQDGCSQEG